MSILHLLSQGARLARAACLAIVMAASSALAQPPIIINNGEVNVTTDTFNNWVVVDNVDFMDPATFTTLIVNSPAAFNGTNFQDTSLAIFATSILEFNGGTVTNDIDFNEDSIGIFNGGLIEDDIYVYDNSTVTINDITLEDDLETYDDSSVTINGGNFVEDIEAFDDSSILIVGGTLGARVRTFDDGEIIIVGSELTFNGDSLGLETQLTGTGTLSGFLSDGTAFSVFLETEDGPGDNFILILPEPSTGLLLLLGGTAFALRRRKR